MAMRSIVRWGDEMDVIPCTAGIDAAVRKLESRKALALRIGTTFGWLCEHWGDEMHVRKHLFSTTQDGSLKPVIPPVMDKWKQLIKDYGEWHGIRALPDVIKFWSELIDAFLMCRDFESQTDPAFKAWAYGCLCRFVLEQRKQDAAPKYDPETNFRI